MTGQILFERPALSYAYIASPYSHDEPIIREQRYLSAAYYVSNCIQAKDHVYSPIVHNHWLAKTFGLRGDFTFWRDFDLTMLSHAYELRILRLDGWEQSRGVREERQFAFDRGIRCVYV